MADTFWTDMRGCREDAPAAADAYALTGAYVAPFSANGIDYRRTGERWVVAGDRAFQFGGLEQRTYDLPDTTLEMALDGSNAGFMEPMFTTNNPPSRTLHQSAVHDGQLFVCGGYHQEDWTAPKVAMARLNVLDLATNAWQQLTTCPEDAVDLVDGGMVAYDGVLYLNVRASMWAYVIATDTWVRLADCPLGDGHTNLLCYGNGTLIRFGLGDTYAYDVRSDAWARVAGTAGGDAQTFGGALFGDLLYAGARKNGSVGYPPRYGVVLGWLNLRTGARGFDNDFVYLMPTAQYVPFPTCVLAGGCNRLLLCAQGYDGSYGTYFNEVRVIS